jgi:hypothetical protein
LPGGGSPGSSSTTYYGSVKVVDITTEEVTYSNNAASVTVWIPNITEAKFDFVFNDMKFDNAMPVKLNIELAGIPFKPTVSEDETTINYIFEAKDIIPTVGGAPYEKYKVDVIKGCIGRSVDIEFEMLSKEKKVYFTNSKSEEK